MLSILTSTDSLPFVTSIISEVDRLGELVQVADKGIESPNLILEDDSIKKTPNWYDSEPPYLFPVQELNKENLLATLFYTLGNESMAESIIESNNDLKLHIQIASKLKKSEAIQFEEFHFVKSNSLHNSSIIAHYGNLDLNNLIEIEKFYEEAIKTATDVEIKMFSVKHFSNFLLDQNEFEKSESLLRKFLDLSGSKDAEISLKVQLANSIFYQLSYPFQAERLEEALNLFNTGINYYEKNEQFTNAGLLLINAAEVLAFQENFIDSLKYINKAIAYFKQEEIPEFIGEAGISKATLLYGWSKNGQPQYYKQAINAFQDTLKIFKKDTHSKRYADIKHQLAILYSEIPAITEEKSMWTAFCASSFKEAIEVFDRLGYKYEYAMACHNYGTALINFPEAKMHDNLEKANQYYEEALKIRNRNQFPFERASTLINQLELFWLMKNENLEEEYLRMNQMRQKIEEIKELNLDEKMTEKVKFHEEKLAQLNLN